MEVRMFCLICDKITIHDFSPDDGDKFYYECECGNDELRSSPNLVFEIKGIIQELEYMQDEINKLKREANKWT